MNVIRTTVEELSPTHRPAWSTASSSGVFKIACDGAKFDRHHHDCHEYWFIIAGKAKVIVGGKVDYIKKGDIVCIERDADHDLLEIYEDIEAFWFEEAVIPGGRMGHLHRSEREAVPHPVPAKAVPADFPT